ncbi:Uncharacterized [Syntrophomonas zehnderi OL-4]|uniref:Uncharacterized n=1 Tax=Syntrophomonas zehnderi OL-4 TaxID=690567 RepID=A0A0E4C933_9FIRM|nr:Uncharacterized [Syntrophomonas zehnderi OL-4]
MLNTTPATIEDLKQILANQKIDSTNLRIIASPG